jgi:hypothetical protein
VQYGRHSGGILDKEHLSKNKLVVKVGALGGAAVAVAVLWHMRDMHAPAGQQLQPLP